ncbi:protein kinase [Streptomyces sp. NPDC001508]|uniref:protein kinase domain-containing protein n=1 Tax=Streptomyces sp. NPDC001508 TaxID=3154656 RepID=UPI003327422F
MNGENDGVEPLEAEDPRWIGPIPLLGRLGVGGMGRVYLGVHEGRYAAVKQVLPLLAEDEGFLRHFGHELDNLSRLPADATAPLLTSDRDARPPWLATAYVPGLTLAEVVGLHGGGLPAECLWLLLREAASGLRTVHELEMVHRDLKPSNVMLTLDGVTLIDFGVARAVDQSRLTKTGMVVGTPSYMSPEQASGARQLTSATDVFALGSLLAYAAGGRPPFGDGSGLDLLYRIVHDEPDLAAVRAVDAEFADVVAACLDKDPEGRPTAAELTELACAHGPFASSLWPASITERLSERAAFAARVPAADELPAPVPALPATEPAQPEAQEPGPGPGPGAGAGPERRERRRTRILFAVVPVVVVATGTTLAIQHLPYVSSPQDEARVTASARMPTSVAASTPAASDGSPSGTASPGKSPSSTPSAGHREGGGTGSDSSGSGGSGDSSSSGRPGGSGKPSGSGGSGTSGNSSGRSTSSGGTSTSSDYFQLKDVGYGKCLSVTYGIVFATCSDSPATNWTTKAGESGSYKLKNESTGQCLSVNVNQPYMADCGSGTGQDWRTGTSSTLVNQYSSLCFDESATWPVLSSCEPTKSTQHWSRI